MPDPHYPPLRRHLFALLGLIFVATSLLLALVVWGFMATHQPPDAPAHASFRRNNRYHFQDLANRIGRPPNLERAGRIARDLSLEIRIQGPGLEWASNPGTPPMAEFEPQEMGELHGPRGGRAQGRFFMRVEEPPYTYLFLMPGRLTPPPPPRFIATMAGALLLVLLVSYLAVRLLLRPLNLMVAGARELERGNLDYQIPATRRVTELNLLAESFNRMARAVREAVRARERLLLDVSHELRSPLTRMNLALEMMPPSEQREAAVKAAGEMQTMIREILETERLKSAPGALSPKPCNLAGLAAEAVGRFKGQKPGVRLLKPPLLPRVPADEGRLAIVLRNVLENALKHTPAAGRKVELSLHDEPRHVRIEVRDHGAGIPPQDLPYLFEPFYRADKSRNKRTGGFGLGLALCREIMRAHAGEIAIANAEGGGAKVTLRLPKGPA